MKTADFSYHLPPECIAQKPAHPRDAARLLVYNREEGRQVHTRFSRLGEHLEPGDCLVINTTKVLPARIRGKKADTGGKVELLLLEKDDPITWQAWVGGSGLTRGKRMRFGEDLEAEVIEVRGGPLRIVRFDRPVEPVLEKLGVMPLPPYIHADLEDPDRYQTVYARQTGSAAAPTAGLHFTPELMTRLRDQGVLIAPVILRIGLDTFAPVQEEDPREHQIHTEYCQLREESARVINQAAEAGGRVIAVGTTAVRTLETAALGTAADQVVRPFQGPTDLFILPGYEFRAVDAMITNFHLPGSTLLMLVSAFCGREKILDLYRQAVEEGYRFYSFGDAMFLE
ncbi:MAG: tRNA preQ1(34) S-adenosylmethionine ribosyltransferase-isomerase QueA [Anaerolineales bacterium]|nr:tRNA preQ1(34) S-adenosylmethionine ribosyltransferase-isomerase QueA [Anaerolineales bacterium]